ncbi:MAG TPA: hypothetical protein QGF63_02185, partial [Alphaproteobacteria bacterium]|nr:hypothetical protein [Alphaproteobacteria bacterium]
MRRYSANSRATAPPTALPRLALLAGLIALLSAASAPSSVARQAGDSVSISAAGDIADCPGRLGSATARLLDELPGPILALG